MCRFCICSIVLSVSVLCAKSANGRQLLKTSDLKEIRIYGELEWKRWIRIGKDVRLLARIYVTSKGNGGLRLGNLYLKVYDNHQNLSMYANRLLTIDVVDLDRDGYSDLIISGVVLYYDEKGDESIFSESIVFVYMFDKKKRKFVRRLKRATFNLENGPEGIPKSIRRKIMRSKGK